MKQSKECYKCTSTINPVLTTVTVLTGLGVMRCILTMIDTNDIPGMTIMNTPISHNILSKKKLSLKRLSQKMLREMALQSYMLNQPHIRPS